MLPIVLLTKNADPFLVFLQIRWKLEVALFVCFLTYSMEDRYESNTFFQHASFASMFSYLYHDKDHMRSTNVWSPFFFFFFIPSTHSFYSISFHSTRLSCLDFLHSFANLLSWSSSFVRWGCELHRFIVWGCCPFVLSIFFYKLYRHRFSLSSRVLYIYIFTYVSMYIEYILILYS